MKKCARESTEAKVKKSKTSFEKILAIFDETHKVCSWEGIKKWREELKANNWTDDEFDIELQKRILMF